MASTRNWTPLLVRLAIGLLAACWLSACVVDEEEGLVDPEDLVSQAANEPEVIDVADEVVSGAESILAGCSHVQWCNESGPRGSICIQDGCTHQQSVNECCEDIDFVCGAPTNPAYITHPGGVTHQIVCP